MPERRRKIFYLILSAGIFILSVWETNFWVWSAVMVAAAAGAGISAYWRPGRSSTIPAVFLIGFFGTMAGISPAPARVLVGLLAGALFYFHQILQERKILSLEQTFVIASVLFVSVFVSSLNFFFNVSWPAVTVLNLLFLFAILSSVFSLLWALAGALLLTEIFWATLFLPVHFLTGALVQVAMFYLFYTLGWLHQQGHLSKKRIYFHTAMVLFILVLGFLSSSWHAPAL